MFDLLDNLVPLLIFVMLLRGILDVLLGRNRRHQQEEQPAPDDDTEPDYPPAPMQTEELPDKPDLASEFERRLKRSKPKTIGAEDQPKPKVYVEKEQPAKEERINTARTDSQRIHHDAEPQHDAKGRVHHDNEPQHDAKGRIHYDNELRKHDKSKVYRDPRGDYSYDEAKFNAEAAAFSARYARQEEQRPLPRVRLKHRALVNGFIMAQVLDKPRALKPYGEDEHL